MKNNLLKYILILSLLLNFSLLGAAGYTYYHVHHQSRFPLTAPVNCGIQDNHLFAAVVPETGTNKAVPAKGGIVP